MDRGGVRPERAVLGQQLHGRAARGGEAGLVLGALLGDVEVQRLAARELDDGGELVGRHGADGVDRGADLRALDRATRSAHLAASPSLKPRWAAFGGSPKPPAR